MAQVRWFRVVLTVALIMALILFARGYEHKLPISEKTGEQTGEIIIRLYVHSENRVINIPLEKYLIGVVAAEMPASFEPEALKSQAVAARTYILRRIPPFQVVKGNNPIPGNHEGADICDLPEHGQAWVDDLTLQKRWGKAGFPKNYKKILDAVQATEGMVLTYRGDIINPLYHASCGGLGTESAKEVWGGDVPYLTAVTCPEEETEPSSKRQYQFTVQELDGRLGTDLEAYPAFRMSGRGGPLEILEQSKAGRIKTIRLGDKRFSGSLIRSKLQLASTRFTMKLANGNIRIETTGYGHAVGLCQRGANAFAQKGKGFADILEHYYPGTELARLKFKHK